MSHRLFELVEFQKSVRKVIKDRMKSLRKQAKKARKNEDEELSLEDARRQLDGALDLLTTYADTAAAREDGEGKARVDLEIDGEVIVGDLTPRMLLSLKKPLKRIEKAARAISRVHADRDISTIGSRASRLRSAIDRAVERANALQVEERSVAEPLIDYLRG